MGVKAPIGLYFLPSTLPRHSVTCQICEMTLDRPSRSHTHRGGWWSWSTWWSCSRLRVHTRFYPPRSYVTVLVICPSPQEARRAVILLARYNFIAPSDKNALRPAVWPTAHSYPSASPHRATPLHTLLPPWVKGLPTLPAGRVRYALRVVRLGARGGLPAGGHHAPTGPGGGAGGHCSTLPRAPPGRQTCTPEPPVLCSSHD